MNLIDEVRASISSMTMSYTKAYRYQGGYLSADKDLLYASFDAIMHVA